VRAHFGEEGNTTHLRPELVSGVVDLIWERGEAIPHRLQHAVQGNEDQ
jgi:uncharacterized Fe-S center protein